MTPIKLLLWDMPEISTVAQVRKRPESVLGNPSCEPEQGLLRLSVHEAARLSNSESAQSFQKS